MEAISSASADGREKEDRTGVRAGGNATPWRTLALVALALALALVAGEGAPVAAAEAVGEKRGLPGEGDGEAFVEARLPSGVTRLLEVELMGKLEALEAVEPVEPPPLLTVFRVCMIVLGEYAVSAGVTSSET